MNTVRTPPTRIIALFAALLMTASGCVQDHLATLDGKPALAVVKQDASHSIRLIDNSGRSFALDSSTVVVEFTMNWFSDSVLTIKDAEHTATFKLDKDALTKNGSTYQISSQSSGQPVDLKIEETVKILKQWIAYREESTPIYSTMTDANGNMTSYVTGYIDDYYRDTVGNVERGVVLSLSHVGAHEPGQTLNVFVSRKAERIASQPITYQEYRKNKK